MVEEQKILSVFENYLKEQIGKLTPSKTRDAMEYSLMAGGKRVRPMLLFRTLESYGLPYETGLPAAAAIEMIHTYSLIHDDLPAMDNDDFRRGRPSCHKAFDEATAILAGDALLTEAFRQVLNSDASASQKVKLVEALSRYAGADGMVYGQDLDIRSESEKPSAKLLEDIDRYKTGCLIQLPLESAALLASAEEDIPALRQAGEKIGIQFQIQDDILDVTKTSEELGKTSSDIRNDKMTAVSLMGLAEAENEVKRLDSETRALIESTLPDPAPVQSVISALLSREK